MDTSATSFHHSSLETRFHSGRASCARKAHSDQQCETAPAQRQEKTATRAGCRRAKSSTTTAACWNKTTSKGLRPSARVSHDRKTGQRRQDSSVCWFLSPDAVRSSQKREFAKATPIQKEHRRLKSS